MSGLSTSTLMRSITMDFRGEKQGTQMIVITLMRVKSAHTEPVLEADKPTPALG